MTSRTGSSGAPQGAPPGPRQGLPPVLDTNEFTRSGAPLAGELPLVRATRLADVLSSTGGNLAWSVAGHRTRRADGGIEQWLTLHLQAQIALPCIRCLRPVAAELLVDRRFKLAGDETLAAREDVDADDYDVLVGGTRFDLGELIEDEALLGLPGAPRHEDCNLPAFAPGSPQFDAASEQARVDNPFARLAALRRGDKDGGNEGGGVA